MSADLAVPIRDALVASSEITALLATYAGEPAIFTRRPVPGNTVFPCILISPDITVNSEDDGINDFRPLATREVVVYSNNDVPESYRKADQIAYLVRNLFHRQRNAIVVPSWHVMDIVVTGPAPTSQDDQIEGRVVTLDIRLAQNRSQ